MTYKDVLGDRSTVLLNTPAQQSMLKQPFKKTHP